MCNRLSSQEKKVVGVFTMAATFSSLYPAYGLYKSVSAYLLSSKVSDCVCSRFSNLTAVCETSIKSIIGPGLSITNATSFCKDATSQVNVVLSNATYEIVVNTLFAGAIFGGSAYMAWKAIRNLRQQQAVEIQ